jgi:hypothetical protein
MRRVLFSSTTPTRFEILDVLYRKPRDSGGLTRMPYFLSVPVSRQPDSPALIGYLGGPGHEVKKRHCRFRFARACAAPASLFPEPIAAVYIPHVDAPRYFLCEQ